MPTKESYSQLLRDPRWQRKRLEIMQRDEFTCQLCFSSEQTLHVHHRYYKYGNDPWDYPDAALVTLCSECHAWQTEALKESQNILIESMARCGAFAGEFHELACAFTKHFDRGLSEPTFSAIAWAIENPVMFNIIVESFWAEMFRRNRKNEPENLEAESKS